jgi:hypothetical protein
MEVTHHVIKHMQHCYVEPCPIFSLGQFECSKELFDRNTDVGRVDGKIFDRKDAE